jgi:hypothetical protein
MFFSTGGLDEKLTLNRRWIGLMEERLWDRMNRKS